MTDGSITTIEPRHRLIETRIARGFETAKDAAEAFGWTVSTYQKHESGYRELSRKAAVRYGAAFGVEPGWLLYGDDGPAGKIPIVHFGGVIGAGQEVFPSDQLDVDIEGLIGQDGGEAFEVSGDSMVPLAWPRDIVFFGTPRPPRQLIGVECIVELVDGRRLFKTIQRGSRQGLYDLVSYNATPIRDVEIMKAGPLLGVKRRRHP